MSAMQHSIHALDNANSQQSLALVYPKTRNGHLLWSIDPWRLVLQRYAGSQQWRGLRKHLRTGGTPC
jgi:hypothetical protein